MTLSEKLIKFAKKTNIGDSMKDFRFGKIPEYIPTKAAIINLAFSARHDHGIPIGKSVMFAGPTSSGKTQMALSTIKEAQKRGYTIVYWDSEFAAEAGIFNQLNVDLDGIVHMPMAGIDDIRTSFMNMNEEIEVGDKVLHIFDSMGAWISSKTKGDALEGKDTRDMTISSAKKTLLTLINEACGKKHMGAIIINHSYTNVGGYGTATTVSGGGALYLPSVIVEFLTKAKWKVKAKGDQIGNIFSFHIKKSRLSREGKKEHFAMSNDNGISKYYGLLNYAIEGKYLKESKKGNTKAYQLTFELEGAENPDDVKKYVESDVETFYNSEEVFGKLFEKTDFGDFLFKKFSYGLNNPAPLVQEEGVVDSDGNDLA